MNARTCLRLARHAAKAAGFASPRALYDHVIMRGYVHGECLAAFTRAQAYLLHVVQPLQWAADPTDAANRRVWLATAHRGAFLIALSGRA